VRAGVERQIAWPHESAIERGTGALPSRRATRIQDGQATRAWRHEVSKAALTSSAVNPTSAYRLRRALRPIKQIARRAELERDAALARVRRADVAFFHEFAPAPAGGGHQTLRAVAGELRRRGVRVGINAISPTTCAVLFNSFNFDFGRFEWFAKRASAECRMVHRVGAVTSLYRGFDDGTDRSVAEMNHRFADATIAISHATIDMYRSIGIELVAPRVIYNGTDPAIFHAHGRVPFDRGRKTRLVVVSWSDNPRKGGPFYRWLESEVDWDRYELTYVGNTREEFARAKVVPPLPSHELASFLRTQDIFVTATENDAYSNALVEALCCGLPAIYLRSGGSAEAVKDAGFGFTDWSEVPVLLDRLRDEYEERQAQILLPTLVEVTDEYLVVLGLDEFVGVRA
jgi:glycosyltransferase involved in cell wall biosynthesis